MRKVELEIYKFSELGEQAKEAAKRNYLEGPSQNRFFYEDVTNDIGEDFPFSTLKVEYDLSHCQGDGLNIYGDLSLKDAMAKVSLSEEEKQKVIKLLYDNDYNKIALSYNSRYTYSMKFIDRKNAMEYVTEFSVITTEVELLKKFFNEIFDYLEKYEAKQYEAGDEFINNISDEDFSDLADSLDWEFYENGERY